MEDSDDDECMIVDDGPHVPQRAPGKHEPQQEARQDRTLQDRVHQFHEALNQWPASGGAAAGARSTTTTAEPRRGSGSGGGGAFAPLGAQAGKGEAGGDDKIEFLAETLSLLCPISMRRIVVPIKGKACTHRACFDRDTWAQYQGSVNKAVTCPIQDCKQQIEGLEDTKIDNDISAILKKVGAGQNAVVLGPDGKVENRSDADDVVIIDDD